MTSSQRRLLGFGLLALALVLIAIAISTAWSGVQRWQAVSETRQAAVQLRRERVAEARAIAARAAARVPDEAAPALLAADLTAENTAERLSALALRCAPADRHAVRAAIGMSNVLRRRPPEVDLGGTGDGRLLEAAWAAINGREPERSSSSEDERAPQHQILRATLQLMLRQAWQTGKAADAAGHAATLLLLRPRAPDAMVLRLLIAAASPAIPDAEVVRLGTEIKDGREPILRALCTLLPARRTALAARWPELAGAKP